MIAVLWAYDGWIHISYVAGEIKNPQRNIPLALLFSVTIVSVIYLLVNVAYLYVLGLGRIAESKLVASDTATAVLGDWGAAFVTVAVLLSTFGANNGFILAGARIYYAMARDGLFFRWVSHVNSNTHTPNTSLMAQGAWSCLLALSGTFDQLITYVIFASWIFYGMSCGAVFILRRRLGSQSRPYRTWGYPVTPFLFILFSILLVANSLIENPADSVRGAGILLLGLPVYYYFKKEKDK